MLLGLKTEGLKQIDEKDLERGRNPDLNRMFFAVYMDQQERAQQIYDSQTPERQAVPIALEGLSLLQMNRGDCAAALATLERAHGGKVPIYGQVPPSDPRANSNLALNRVYCLRRLGRQAEGDPIMGAEDFSYVLQRVPGAGESLRREPCRQHAGVRRLAGVVRLGHAAEARDQAGALRGRDGERVRGALVVQPAQRRARRGRRPAAPPPRATALRSARTRA